MTILMGNLITGTKAQRILDVQEAKRVQQSATPKAPLTSDQKRRWFMDAFVFVPLTFLAVFALAYTLLTWPLIPERIAYLVRAPSRIVEAAPDQSLLDIAAILAPGRKAKKTVTSNDVSVLSVTKSFPKTQLDQDGDGLNDDAESRFYGTDPTNPDSDGDGLLDGEEVALNQSPLVPAGVSPDLEKLQNHLIIPKLDVNVPVVWSTALSEEDRLADLDQGVIHYVETSYPGKQGNMVIAGHSSAPGWQQAKYGTAFSLLDQLHAGDDLFLYYQNKIFSYKVRSVTIDVPNRTDFLEYTESPTLTLITCYPTGDNSRRLYLQADLQNIGRTVGR